MAEDSRLIWAISACEKCGDIVPAAYEFMLRKNRVTECKRCSAPKAKVYGQTRWLNTPMTQEYFDQHIAKKPKPVEETPKRDFDAEVEELMDDVELGLLPKWKSLMAAYCTEYLEGRQPDPQLLSEVNASMRGLADQMDELARAS